jgi:hypothetical protein
MEKMRLNFRPLSSKTKGRRVKVTYQFGALLFIVSFSYRINPEGPPLWSSGQSFWLLTQGSMVRFPALPDFSEQQWVWNGVHSAS